ncbi:hypothetical protein [Thalassotalea sp. G2M2-11]|uniref:hypothetical protein n=1 Tax=Thalassotalea sp. G2M2-11 TaxID=2787627 RepID=UPI0019D2CAC2|nr:hypothetical protein [Thalassotalea sp. G2M2-11]
MSNRVEPEIPSITLDQDQVKSSHHASSAQKSAKAESSPVKSSSKGNTLLNIVIIAGLAASSWYFYQENIKLQALIGQSEQRIQSLENQLSATGEEMGESTIALKAKLEAITEKTEKLWEEMDKLWASAWRRNQSEIKTLRSDSKKLQTASNNHTQQLKNTIASLATINDKLTANELNMNALADQITAANSVQNDIANIRNEVKTLSEKSSNRDAQQIEVATSVNQLEMSVTLLVERLEQLERSQGQSSSTIPSQ